MLSTTSLYHTGDNTVYWAGITRDTVHLGSEIWLSRTVCVYVCVYLLTYIK